jgi:hypothetical protein
MKLRVEQYGNKIGIDGNLADLISKKKISILLTISNDDDTHRSQFIISKKEALELASRIEDLIEDKKTKELGFEYV